MRRKQFPREVFCTVIYEHSFLYQSSFRRRDFTAEIGIDFNGGTQGASQRFETRFRDMMRVFPRKHLKMDGYAGFPDKSREEFFDKLCLKI